MILRKYGLEFSRLRENDIELVRKMRNKTAIKNRMFYQKNISESEQKAWFQKINTIYNYYFIISNKGNKIGLIHGNVLSFEDRIAEGGMFIWDENSQKSHLPVISSICLADLTFLIMEMKKTKAEIRTDNPRAIDYNLKLGYEITEKIEDEKKLKMELTKKNYFEKAGEIRQMIKRIGRDFKDISWNDIEFTQDYPDYLYTGLPEYLQEKINQKQTYE